MMRFLNISIFLMFISSCSTAQKAFYSTKSKKAIKAYEAALDCFNDIDAFTGMPDVPCVEAMIQKALKKDSTFVEAYSLASNMCIENGEIEKAIFYREKMIAVAKRVPIEEFYFLAGMQIATGRYEDCLRNAKHYLNSPLANSKLSVNANRMVDNCLFALNAIENPVDFEPINLGPEINTDMPEYFPSITADDSTLLFTRMVKDNLAPMGNKQEDIFTETKKTENSWNPSYMISSKVNTMYNEGAPTFSSDGKYVIFVGCETGAKGDYEYGFGRTGKGSCDLFYSQKNGDEWSQPVNLGPPINTKHWETQPSFSSDGKTLYFVRGLTFDRQRRSPDNQDIYSSQITSNGWTKPIRLSSVINTPYREESVQIHPDGQTLYFSSNGHQGMGGLDIFMSRKDSNGIWTKPINMGYPVNTYMDENSVLISSKGDLAYFSSNRPEGFGSLDLYSFEIEDDYKPIPTTFVKGFVYDEEDMNPLEASFQLTNLKNGKIVSEIIANPISGQFLIALPTNIEMAFHAEKEGYSFVSKNFSFSDLEETDEGYQLNIPMRKIKPGTFILENIFFDVNKWDIKKSSVVELEKILKLLSINPKIKAEISGHTDSDGDEDDNLILSTNRANAVVDWLINRGISKDRLSYVGYGEKRPIVENSSETNKAKNRRTELTIK
ncbi:MAG: hypothetical protein CL846_10765 [Crocinitomicaceae bacterium]|nr:hypothetical protein [Crocinitomicaceae bacterium]